MFAPGQAVDCLLISIIPDSILELDETFSVTLLSNSDPGVIIGRDSTTVTILNDDSKSGK